VSAAAAWVDANQRTVTAALAYVKLALERHVEVGAQGREDASPPSLRGSALERLQELFGLSPFERDVLLLCAGVELDAAVAALCARGHGRSGGEFASFGLALAALDEPHWSALAPAAPLRYWRLVELDDAGSATAGALRIDERILHYIAGIDGIDARLGELVEAVGPRAPVPPSHEGLARAAAEHLAGARPPAAVVLCGPDRESSRAVALAASVLLGAPLRALRAEHIPALGEQADTARAWDREAVLSGALLLLECAEADVGGARAELVERFADRLDAPVMISTHEPLPGLRRAALRIEVPRPTAGERRVLWAAALGERAAALNGRIDSIVAQFDVAPSAVVDTVDSVGQGSERGVGELADSLWEACRAQARPRLDDLAQRVVPASTWDDLVLPATHVSTLRQLAAHVRRRTTVYERWGFAARSSRGLGVTALFSGPSGTGKTMAAEVLANELQLDLYRIDLSAVVSKYIGETEKNLRRVFDTAEGSGAILLFDEADALFGKRTEVRDSHDRYANIEVSYLLQRMEAYLGLAILTTNLEGALDTAFMRRIRFVLRFPFPDAAQRSMIWRRAFPAATPVDDLDVERLARLDVAGGSIRDIGLNAAFLAADEGGPVRMEHVLEAARSEYSKLERPLSDLELESTA
jgi:ATPase family associated with various cellular activities (AAA)